MYKNAVNKCTAWLAFTSLLLYLEQDGLCRELFYFVLIYATAVSTSQKNDDEKDVYGACTHQTISELRRYGDWMCCELKVAVDQRGSSPDWLRLALQGKPGEVYVTRILLYWRHWINN